VQCEYYALEGLGQLTNTINLVKENLNPDLEIEGVLLTMADFRTNLTQEVITETRNFFGARVFDTIIPRSIRLSEAPGFGKPIHFYDKNSIGAEKYAALAKEVLVRSGQTVDTPEASMPTPRVEIPLSNEVDDRPGKQFPMTNDQSPMNDSMTNLQ
jgi:cellulose biosynthesis protein BcsQ